MKPQFKTGDIVTVLPSLLNTCPDAADMVGNNYEIENVTDLEDGTQRLTFVAHRHNVRVTSRDVKMRE